MDSGLVGGADVIRDVVFDDRDASRYQRIRDLLKELEELHAEGAALVRELDEAWGPPSFEAPPDSRTMAITLPADALECIADPPEAGRVPVIDEETYDARFDDRPTLRVA